MANCPHTIGVEFGTRIIEVAGQKIKLQIWDTGKLRCSSMLDQIDKYSHFASWPGALPGGNKILLSWCGRCAYGLRHYKTFHLQSFEQLVDGHKKPHQPKYCDIFNWK